MTDQRWRIETWTDLAAWLDYARSIDAIPRASTPIDASAARLITRFPAELINIELDQDTLRGLRALFTDPRGRRFCRPPRGRRAGHPTTPWIKAINNQLARLERGGAGNNRDEKCPGD